MNTIGMTKQQKESLLNPEQDQHQNQPKYRGFFMKTAVIAMISTAGVILWTSFFSVCAQSESNGGGSGEDNNFVLTPDAAHWKKVGVENAHRDLDRFPDIVSSLHAPSPDYSALHDQLKLFSTQLSTVGENNRVLIPNIMTVINQINSFLDSDTPSLASKIGLKALIWYVDGKRDNKSYYLLDGAALWCQLRLQQLKTSFFSSSPTDKLREELEKIQHSVNSTRDELDGMAQIFVKGIKDIHSLVGDIGGNIKQLRDIAAHLQQVSGAKDEFMTHSEDLVKNGQVLVDEYAKK